MHSTCIRNTTFIALTLITLLGAQPYTYAMNSDPKFAAADRALQRERDRAKHAIKLANNLWYADGHHALRGAPFCHDVPPVNFKSMFLYPDLVQLTADENLDDVHDLLTDNGMNKHYEDKLRKQKSAGPRFSNTETRDLLLFAAAAAGEPAIVQALLFTHHADRNAFHKLHNGKYGSITHHAVKADVAHGKKLEVIKCLNHFNRSERRKPDFHSYSENRNTIDHCGCTVLDYVQRFAGSELEGELIGEMLTAQEMKEWLQKNPVKPEAQKALLMGDFETKLTAITQDRPGLAQAVKVLLNDFEGRTYSEREYISPAKVAIIIDYFMRDYAPEKQFVDELDVQAQELTKYLKEPGIIESLLVPCSADNEGEEGAAAN